MTWTKKIKKEQIEDFISDEAQTVLNDRARTILNCNTAPTAINLTGGSGVVLYYDCSQLPIRVNHSAFVPYSLDFFKRVAA